MHSIEISTSHEAKFIPTLKSAIACIFFLFRNLQSLCVCMCSHAHAYGNTHEQACAHTCMHAHVTSYLWLAENNFEELSSSVTSVCILETELPSQGLHRKGFYMLFHLAGPVANYLKFTLYNSSHWFRSKLGETSFVFKYYFMLCPY